MDNIYQHDIESVLKDLILRKLTVTLSKRIQKTGKLILYRIVNHNIELVLGESRDESTHVTCLLPYPFDYKHDRAKKRVILNYEISRLLPDIHPPLQTSAYKPSKILNNTFAISYE